MPRKNIALGTSVENDMAFSRGVVFENFCFVAGTTGVDPDTSELADSFTEQAKSCFKTIEQILGKAGFSLSDSVRATYYVTNSDYLAALGPVIKEVFKDIRPAATVLIAQLPSPAMKIEIEITAMKA